MKRDQDGVDFLSSPPVVEVLISGSSEGMSLGLAEVLGWLCEALPMFGGREVRERGSKGLVQYYWVEKGSRGEQRVIVFAQGPDLRVSRGVPLRLKFEFKTLEDSRKAALTFGSRIAMEGVEFAFQETSVVEVGEVVESSGQVGRVERVVETPAEYVQRVGFRVGGFDQPYARRVR